MKVEEMRDERSDFVTAFGADENVTSGDKNDKAFPVETFRAIDVAEVIHDPITGGMDMAFNALCDKGAMRLFRFRFLSGKGFLLHPSAVRFKTAFCSLFTAFALCFPFFVTAAQEVGNKPDEISVEKESGRAAQAETENKAENQGVARQVTVKELDHALKKVRAQLTYSLLIAGFCIGFGIGTLFAIYHERQKKSRRNGNENE